MRGREFIRIAKKMELMARTETGDRREAWLREAIGAIYYGTLWEVVAFLKEQGTQVKRDWNIHATVRESLRAKGYAKASERMRSLHKLRKRADYDKDYPISRKTFKKAITLSKLILMEVGR